MASRTLLEREKKRKRESALSTIITYALVAAAAGMLIYRFTR